MGPAGPHRAHARCGFPAWRCIRSDPADEIAWRVGYEDPGAFRKVFHRLMGLSPGEYRRRFAVRREG